MEITLTGSSGFIGKNILQATENNSYRVNQLTKNELFGLVSGAGKKIDLKGNHSLIHTAGIAHSHAPKTEAEIAHIFRINTELTLRLAEASKAAGVKQFIYLSSAHVYGQSRTGWLNEEAETAPPNIYAESKLLAEEGLLALTANTDMRVIILRMPLVYGPHVKANFLKLMRLVSSGLPVPFKRATALRSMLYAGNLTHALEKIVDTPEFPGGIYNIADAQPISTHDLVHELAHAMKAPIKEISVAPQVMHALLRLIGKETMYRSLFEPLQLDITKLQKSLAWSPPVAQKEGIQRTADWYLHG